MATLIPQMNPDRISPSGERRVIKLLLDQLPEQALLYHSYETLAQVQRKQNQASGKQKRLLQGEIDVVVVLPDRGVLVLEIKGGEIYRDNDMHRWMSTDKGGETFQIKNPFEQGRKNSHHLIDKFAAVLKKDRQQLPFPCGYAVVFPDCHWQGELPADAEQTIVSDGTQNSTLGKFVEDAIGKWRNDYHFNNGVETNVKSIRRALSGEFNLIPLLSRQIEDEQEQFVRLTDQQKNYLDFTANIDRAKIEGVAGSGKTMLAVEQCRRYAEQGLSTLLLCYNKGLSAWLRSVISHDLASLVTVHHFHEWCHAACQQHGIEFKPEEAPSIEAFWTDTAPELLMKCSDQGQEPFDAIVIDEGQDFHTDWWIAIDAHLKQDGKFFVFYDQAQDIFRVNGMETLEDLQQFTLPVNCRNTRVIADYCGDVLGSDIPTADMTPDGLPIVKISGDDTGKVNEDLERLVEQWLNQDNLKPCQVVIQSPFVKGKSGLRDVEYIAGVRLTESVDDWHRNAGILYSTIRAFKGREADVVVLVDAPEEGRHKVFSKADKYVACSRARSLLVIT